MVRSSVRVLLRTRPSLNPNPNVQFAQDKKSIVITVPFKQDSAKQAVVLGPGGNQYQFKFDTVLHEVSQEDVFEAAASDVLHSLLEGLNGTIMCYGQTGAGKTYTMSGGRQSFKQRGLIPRLLTQLFQEIKTQPDSEFKVSVTFLEIYNEQLYDLLDNTTQPHEIIVHERPGASQGTGAGGGVAVSGLRSVVVDSEAEALQLLFEGETNRVIGEHQLNRESSRSHSIFTIALEMRGTGGTDSTVVASKLHMVDLAGSERVSKTRSEGSVLREAGYINKSLSILEQVTLALSEKGRDHVPYRSSRLTHVLRDSLGGNCKTVLIANVWGEADQTDETLSTCRFAQRMARITCEVTPNVTQDGGALAKALQRQVAALQAELAMHDAMAGRQAGQVTYGPYTPQQREMLREQVAAFLAPGAPEDSIEPIELMSLRHIREVLLCVKSMYRERVAGLPPPGPAATHANAAPPSAGNNPSGPHSSCPSVGPKGLQPAGGAATAAGSAQVGVGEADGVGEVDAVSQGGGVGVAPEDAAPRSSGGGGPTRPPLVRTSLTEPPQPVTSWAGGPPPDRKAALSEFQATGPGAAKAALLTENRTRLRNTKKKAKELGLAVNAAKRDMDAAKLKADKLKTDRLAKGGDEVQAMSEEELVELAKIRDAKQRYRDAFGELQMVKSEVEYTQQLVDTCAKEVLADFSRWYLDQYGVAPHGDGVSMEMEVEDAVSGTGDPLSPGAQSTRSSLGPSPSVISAAPSASPSVARSEVTGATPVRRPAAGPGVVRGATNASPVRRRHVGVTPPRQKPVPSQPDPSELSSAEAMAFYAAQQKLLEQTTGAAHRPGNVKKRMVEQKGATFSSTNRAI